MVNRNRISHERNYKNLVAGTSARSDRKGDTGMFGKIVGWTLLAIASFALGAYMVIATAMM